MLNHRRIIICAFLILFSCTSVFAQILNNDDEFKGHKKGSIKLGGYAGKIGVTTYDIENEFNSFEETGVKINGHFRCEIGFFALDNLEIGMSIQQIYSANVSDEQVGSRVHWITNWDQRSINNFYFLYHMQLNSSVWINGGCSLGYETQQNLYRYHEDEYVTEEIDEKLVGLRWDLILGMEVKIMKRLSAGFSMSYGSSSLTGERDIFFNRDDDSKDVDRTERTFAFLMGLNFYLPQFTTTNSD